jgi:hypothetical protein
MAERSCRDAGHVDHGLRIENMNAARAEMAIVSLTRVARRHRYAFFVVSHSKNDERHRKVPHRGDCSAWIVVFP